jgi:hypothetical protein
MAVSARLPRRPQPETQTTHVEERTLTPYERALRHREAIRERNLRRLQACEIVPVEPFQVRFLKLQAMGSISFSELARHMGWSNRKDPDPNDDRNWDSTYAKRVLGFLPYPTKPNAILPATEREFIDYDMAVKLCDVLGMDYHEGGV